MEPPLKVGKVRQKLFLSFMGYDPRVNGHIGNGIIVSNPVPTLQTGIEYAVQTICFVDVSTDRIGYLLRGILDEMMILAGHGSQTSHLPHQPFQHRFSAMQTGWHETADLFCEVQKDGT